MYNAPIDDSYDVVVMGGGPGGSATSALVAEAGYSVLLVEREAVPRFHVGESLMPEAFWSFERLGVLDKMRNSDFAKKLSVQFVSHSGKESNPFFFEKHDPRECSQTWQVERSVFDQMLFDNAADKGARCRDKTRVTNVLFDGDRATGVELGLEDGSTQQVKSRVVVDATGLSAILANRLDLRQDYNHLKKIAIWTYFENAERDAGPHGGATIILHTKMKDSWFWFIPLRNNITSVGVVGDRDYMLNGRSTPENTFSEELELCDAMQRRLATAKQVEKHRIAREFSYKTSRQSGDGWVLVGDAFGFIDPIYSSGVYFALKSGELAADAIVDGLQKNDLSAKQLGKWINDYSTGTQWIHKLVEAYYTNEFSFGKFLQGNPHHIGDLTDLLIGRIFHDSAGDIFDDMEPAMAKAVKMGIPK